MLPGERIDKAVEALREEAMRAVADASMALFGQGRPSLVQIVTEERAKLGLTLQEVADRADITKSHVWEIEQGRSRNMTVRTVYGLSQALGVPFLKLADGALHDMERASPRHDATGGPGG